MRRQKNPLFVTKKARREARAKLIRRRTEQVQPEIAELAKPDWMAVPIQDACQARWMAGRAAYGGTSFQGDPAQELYEELLDSLNYVCQMRLSGQQTQDWGNRLFALTEEVQAAYAIRQEPAMAAGGGR